MRIASFTDLRFTGSSKTTGVGKHVVQMIQGLRAKPDVQLSIAATRDQLTADAQIPSENQLAGIDAISIPGTTNTTEALWTLLHWPAADRWIGPVDWVYCPKNDMIALNKLRWAVTVHAVYECDPTVPVATSWQAKLGNWRARKLYRHIVRRADLVLTVSEFLKNQMVDYFHADPNQIVVVGNGVEDIYFQTAEAPAGTSGQPTDRPYVLCVGGLNYFDGAEYLLPVAEAMQKRDPSVRFLLAGHQHEQPYLDRAKELKNLELLGYVQAPQLAGLMRDAAAFLFLSRYETFGIAGAEAMAVGAPVIASNLTAVPEIIGDGGIIVDPTHTDEIVDMTLNLIHTPQLRDKYRDLGRKRAVRYTWSACVDRLYEALKTR